MRRSGAAAAAEQATQEVAERTAEHAAQPALLFLLPLPLPTLLLPGHSPRMLPSRSSIPPDCPPAAAPPPSRFAR